MNPFFAAGLFDSPWVVVAIVVVSALANWISKRRAEKQADHPVEGGEASESSGTPAKPPGEFNLEDALRRFMGESPPAQSPMPPPVPGAARGESPSAPDWQEEEPFQPVRQTAPPLRPPLIAVSQAGMAMAAAGEQEELAARRFEQLNEQGRHPATVVSHGRGYRLRAGGRAASVWRDPRSARRAFVASLVFAPPKGLES